MTRRETSTANLFAVFLILILFLCVVWLNRQSMLRKVESDLTEHVAVVTEPLWNLDLSTTEGYFKAVTEKNNYKSITITGNDVGLQYTESAPETGFLQQFLSYLHLIPLKTFEREISYNDHYLGELILVWRDTSIYFVFYASIVTFLLIIIVQLYAKILSAKKILEDKVEVIEQQIIELRNQKEFTENIFNVVPEGLITLDENKRWVRNNHSFEILVKEWAEIVQKEYEAVKKQLLDYLVQQVYTHPRNQCSIIIDGHTFNIDYASSQLSSASNTNLVISLRDITKITEMERELNQSRKLEAVGRLASGIAHEINTPTQYVFTNIDFLSEAFEDIRLMIADLNNLGKVDHVKTVEEVLDVIKKGLADADWEYLEEEVPKALEQSKDGVHRISAIVGAMKHFAHPSGNISTPGNINNALENTVVVARNEWKYSSEVNLDLDPQLPMVPCYLDELNQVFLGMIVNSAHAISQKYGEDGITKGVIHIATKEEDGFAVIVISDDGIGMSKGVKEKVFDPFFTTKELNKGTGQGLAIAHDVIVNRHKGKITVESEEGLGTTFTIKLPVFLP